MDDRSAAVGSPSTGDLATGELAPLQPLLADETVVLRAPAQAWSAGDGSMGGKPIHGLYVSDVRIISSLELIVEGTVVETIATVARGASRVEFVSLLRGLDDDGADPRVRLMRERTVAAEGMTERLTFESTRTVPVTATVIMRLAADLAPMDVVKYGAHPDRVEIESGFESARWQESGVSAQLIARGARLRSGADHILEWEWDVVLEPKGRARVEWAVAAVDDSAVVAASRKPVPWSAPQVGSGDDRLDRWVAQALDDLDALRLTTTADPSNEFLAAGAPWFFTLFGRDSLWVARLMLPLGWRLAADTLRVLARMQGRSDIADTAEQPGKIMHELRRGTLDMPGEGISLPPLYFGTVDATALWICLLGDAAEAGMPDSEIEPLLPALEAALGWMRDYGDADGDGLLEYVDATGRGLANQGWKDSGDSVQWRDGTLATGPIALCEVQAYAYEAAVTAAGLLDRFGRDGAAWLTWAEVLRGRFRASFWIEDAAGAYPAIALDAQKRPVDTVTSNIGHLLGTGLLDDRESELVARRLVSEELDSGFGLRTMSTDSAGYWPLSYHGGSVWAHDTAIAIRGLARAGFQAEARTLSDGLIAAAVGFDYRMPELHSGDPASDFARPVPYPAACRPQAWSAAAAIQVHALRRAQGPGGTPVAE